eukprot:7280484-Heterocapsa_arctica.AAC.2
MAVIAKVMEWGPGLGSCAHIINDMAYVWLLAEQSPSRWASKRNGAKATRTLWRLWKPGGWPMV